MASEHRLVKRVVNRWVVDFYSFLAVESFKKDEFSGLKDFLTSFLARAVSSAEIIPLKVLVLQFLSSTCDGGKLESIHLLETALTLLKKICQTCKVSPEDLQNVRSLIQKQMVKIHIRNMELDRAKEMVNSKFSSSITDASDASHFLDLISAQKEGQSEDEDGYSEEFQRHMLAFCEKVCTFSPPFLYKAATELNARLEAVHLSAPSAAASLANYQHEVIQRSRLEKAYDTLAAGTNHLTFVELEEAVDPEQTSRPSPSKEPAREEEPCSERHSQSEDQDVFNVPLEPQICEPPRTDASLTDSRGADSQSGSVLSLQQDKCPSPKPVRSGAGASRKRLRDGRVHRKTTPPELPSEGRASQTEPLAEQTSERSESAEDSLTDSSPVSRLHSTPVKSSVDDHGPSTSKWQQLMREARESKETWPEEESFFMPRSRSKNSTFTSGNKKRWTEEETNWLREGVERFGEGRWSKIQSSYRFKNRTNVNLKDRWRTMKKLKMV